MKFRYIITATALLALVACNDNEVFEKEQYKNVFGFISDSENMNSKTFNLHKDESEGYLSFSMGGTNNITQNVTVNIVEDDNLVETYNKNNYDLEVAKYAKVMPKDKYDITNFKCVIKAGEVKGVVPVKVRPAGLSPDTTYLIPVRVDTYDGCEINPEKSYLLYQVQIKNRWAVGDGSTNYTMRGRRRVYGADAEISMPGTKVVYPLSKNTVRVMAGNISFKADMETLYKSALILKIEDSGHVTILPYRDMKVEQLDDLDADYPNTYAVVDDGYNTYKTFMLCYKYTDGKTTYLMKEELRLQFDPDTEDDYEDSAE